MILPAGLRPLATPNLSQFVLQPTDDPAKANTSDLIEELGQVRFPDQNIRSVLLYLLPLLTAVVKIIYYLPQVKLCLNTVRVQKQGTQSQLSSRFGQIKDQCFPRIDILIWR